MHWVKPGVTQRVLEPLRGGQPARRVEAAHALLDGAVGDQSVALDRQPQRFQVRHPELRRRAPRPACHAPRRPRCRPSASASGSRRRRAASRTRGNAGPGEQAAGALEPAGGDGVLAAEVDRVVGEPGGEAGGPAGVVGLAVGAEAAFPGGESRLAVAQPPGRPAQPLPGRAQPPQPRPPPRSASAPRPRRRGRAPPGPPRAGSRRPRAPGELPRQADHQLRVVVRVDLDRDLGAGLQLADDRGGDDLDVGDRGTGCRRRRRSAGTAARAAC